MLVRLLMIVILLAGGASARSQSLAEVAAKEKERRAKTGGSAKSFTDADLRDAASKRAREGTPSADASPPPSVTPPGSDSPAGSSKAAPGEPSDAGAVMAAKKARGAEFKARLDATNAALKQAEEELKAAERDWNYVNDHSWRLLGWVEQTRARFEAAKRKADLLRQQRDDIEDAARREGIPPGYLR